jgi:hypothetical protein
MGELHVLATSNAATEAAALKLLLELRDALLHLHIFTMGSCNSTDTPVDVRIGDLAWRVGYAAGLSGMMSTRITALCGPPGKPLPVAEPTNA